MSKDLNKVRIIGRLGKDPETRQTPQGSAITKFSVAAGRRWRTAEGEDREETEWFNVIAWNKLAETCAQYLQKGRRVYIEGRLQTRSWDDPTTGQKRYMTEVIANDMIMLDSRRDGMSGGGGYEEQDVGFQEPEYDAPSPSARASSAPQTGTRGNGQASAGASRQPAPASGFRRSNTQPQDDEDLPF